MAEPTKPSDKPDASGSPTPTATPDPVDLSKLSGDQLNQVLENPELFKLPRIAELLEAQKNLKKLEKEQADDKEKSLAEQKKFEELANERGETIAKLEKQIQENQVNNALISALSKEKVVDLDGALKLVDKSKLAVGDDGQVTGVDEALTSLKTDKAYLFSEGATPTVGIPSNPTSPTAGTGEYKYKESQLTPEFYAANKAAIDEAGRLGQIEQDGPPPQ